MTKSPYVITVLLLIGYSLVYAIVYTVAGLAKRNARQRPSFQRRIGMTAVVVAMMAAMWMHYEYITQDATYTRLSTVQQSELIGYALGKAFFPAALIFGVVWILGWCQRRKQTMDKRL